MSEGIRDVSEGKRAWAYLALALLATLFVALIPATDRWIVQPSFERLQSKQAFDDAWRVERALLNEVERLQHLLGDWSNWDNTYAFAANHDPEFIRANLSDWQVLEASSALNLCLIVDTNGTVLYRQVYDSDLGGELQLPELQDETSPVRQQLAAVARAEHGMAGFITTGHGLLAIAVQPILTTKGEGTPRGFIAFGRFVDTAVVLEIVERTRVAFTLFQPRPELLAEQEAQLVTSLPTRNPRMLTLPDGRSYVFEVLPGLANEPVAYVRTPVGREVMEAGESVGRVVVIVLLLAIGGLIGVMVLLFVIGGSPVAREARQVLGYEQISRQIRRRNQIWMGGAVCFYIAGVACYAIWTGRRAENELLAAEDQRLLAVARSQRYILPTDFHDRAIAPGAIEPAEEQRLTTLFSDYARSSDVTYLYTLIPYGTAFVFTATSLKDEERNERASWYFHPYADAPPQFSEALEAQRVTFASYTDQWGHFRSAIVPEVSPRGRRYLACADFDISGVRTAVVARMLGSALVAIGFLALALPFVLVYRKAFTTLTLNLSESEASYRGLFDTVDEAIYILDAEGHFIAVNRGAEQMYGHPRSWFVGRTPEHVSAPGRNDLAKTAEQLKQALNGEPQRFRFWGLRASGEVFPKDVQLCRGRYFGQTVIVAVARDITERLAAEEDRLSMERRILHSQKLESLGILAGGIAHDFNNLLLAITGNLELACEDIPADSTARQGLKEAMHAARRAADLTRQMLAYSGRGRFLIQPLDLSATVSSNVNLLRASIAKTISLELHLEPALPAIEADAAQIQQIVMNLIINASEAIGERNGEIAVTTGVRSFSAAELEASRCEDKPPPGRYVFLQVRDNGCGMEPETLQRMFDPFFSTKATGRGLGMSAVLGIVRSHGGALLVESGPGRGTTFRVLFRAGTMPAERESTSPHAIPAAPRVQGCLLVVDDEIALCNVACRMAERLGFKSIRALDGAQAVAIYRERAAEISVVLMDLSMPNMDGVTAFQEMQRIRADVQVVLSSGFGEEDAVARFQGMGLAGFLQKPYSMDSLRNLLLHLAASATPDGSRH